MAKVPKRRQAIEKMVDGAKRYTLEEATALVKSCATAKFSVDASACRWAR